MARSQPVGSTVVAIIVAAVCATVLATTGQTAAQEAAVLGTIDLAGTRSIVITEEPGGPGFAADVIPRVSVLSGVESALGFGAVFDVRNGALQGGGDPVPARVVFGTPTAELRVAIGRWPHPGEATSGRLAAARLGLETMAGSVESDDGEGWPIVGGFDASGPLETLASSVLIAASAGESPRIRSLHIVAEAPESVSDISRAVLEVLSAEDPTSVRIETSERLADLRLAVRGELGRFSRDLVSLTLAVGVILTAITVLGSVSLRRRDFGRRRALGASRTAIVVLVLTQASLPAALGAAAGTSAGLVIVRRLSGALPPAPFVLGVGAVALVVAMCAAAIPAVLTALRDPVRVLRVP